MEPCFACGSVVLFLAFPQKCYTVCNIFVEKHGIFRPAGGDIPFRVSDRVTPIM